MKTIALTIGPIVETLALGRKTSEIWAASYLFSSLMRDTLKELRKREDVEIIVPYLDDTLFESPDGGIGRFHDRFVLRSDTVGMKDVQKIIYDKLDTMAVMISEAIGKRDGSKPNKDKVSTFLKNYIQAYLIESENGDIDHINERLNMVELHTPLIEGENYLRSFLRRDVVLKSKMAADAFGSKPSFQSIPAIAAQEDDKGDVEQSEHFKNAYRYIAIVHADGDNMSKALEAAGSATALSKKMFDFSEKADKTLQNYGAQTLLIGGDDLIFFAPVLYRDGKTIFDLIDALSADFATTFNNVTTISFGVSITYFKYPLYEALEKSRNALEAKAKKYKNKSKNAVALSVQKHSGQSFDFVIGKNEPAYMHFEMLMGDILAKGSELPHSIHHKLAQMQPLIKALPTKEKAMRLKAIFENFFNEELHQSKYKEGLKVLEGLMLTLDDEALQGPEDDENDKKPGTLFAMLSMIKLLRGDR